MNDDVKTYSIDPELAVILKAAARKGGSVLVEADGETFELEVKTSPACDAVKSEYDPEAAREAWESIAGILPDIDAEAWIRQIKEDREQDTPGRKFP